MDPIQFDMTFNLGHLIEVLLIIASAFAAYFKLDKRLALIEMQVTQVQGFISSNSRRLDDNGRRLDVIQNDFSVLRERVSLRRATDSSAR